MLNKATLNQFCGTEHYYKHLSGYSFTDGVKYLADEAGAYWLLDLILFSMREKKFQKHQDFTVWILKVKDTSAILIAEDGNKHKLYSKKIKYTDFPLSEIELWFENGVLILPNEH